MRFIFTIFILSNFAFSQQQRSSHQFKVFQDNLVTQKWDLTVKGFRINDNLFLTMSQNDYFNLINTVKEVPVYLRYSINDKLSILAGAKFDIHRDLNSGSQDLGLSTSFGLQYDYNENTYFQAVFDYQLKQVDNPYHYNYELPASFSFKSGFKF
ncbi:hypothetical protein [Winogradskyella sp. R77965]|uniref:hypothetical protein n=1 Tax=Winogradskyella sp. R77965 TaxID=3093872 RepID=UPI0037DDCCBF